jgi:hypothetical protein
LAEKEIKKIIQASSDIGVGRRDMASNGVFIEIYNNAGRENKEVCVCQRERERSLCLRTRIRSIFRCFYPVLGYITREKIVKKWLAAIPRFTSVFTIFDRQLSVF